jgi:hypothetical protein
VLQWGEHSAQKVHVKKGYGSHAFHLKGRRPFIDCPGVPYLEPSYFTTRVKLHDEWGPRLERSATELAADCLAIFSALGCRFSGCLG